MAQANDLDPLDIGPQRHKLERFINKRYKAHGTRYKYVEDQKIIQTIIKKQWFNYYRGYKIWIWMESDRELNLERSHQSMRDRFNKYILTNIDKYGLTLENARAFKKGFRVVGEGKRDMVDDDDLPPHQCGVFT